MMIHYAKADHWPQRFGDACNAFGGCTFKPVCLAPPRIQSAVLATKYVENTWDPTNRPARPNLLELWKDTSPALI
jgi:hypothetical protein